MKEPTQYLYDELFKLSKANGFDTYDFLPREDVGYPFVLIRSAELNPISTKVEWRGEVSVDVDIFGTAENRSAVAHMGQTLLLESAKFKQVKLLADRCSLQLIPDQSTPDDLWHGKLNLIFEF